MIRDKETPFVSMEKGQLISIIQILVKREDRNAQVNQKLKDIVKVLRKTHKQNMKTQSNLTKTIDKMTTQLAVLTKDNKALHKKVKDFLSQIEKKSRVKK